jgi:hypothetical protein
VWSKNDDKLHDHPKVHDLLEADDDPLDALAALGLWLLSQSWCGDQLSDGRIRESVMRRWAAEHAPRLANRLIDVGLWNQPTVDNLGRLTHEFHDWTDYNDSRATILFNREQNALRAAFARDKALKAAIDERDGDRCRYDGVLVHWADKRSPAGGTYDHVKPLADGGKNTLENVVVACRGCNQRKAKRTLRDAGMRLLPPGSLGAPHDPAHEVGTPGLVGSGRGPSTCDARTPHADEVDLNQDGS